jgi:hypothetical protein
MQKHPSQGIAQLVRLIEVEREGRNLCPEWIHAIHRVRERENLVAGPKEAPGDIASRVSKCPCDGDPHTGLCRARR